MNPQGFSNDDKNKITGNLFIHHLFQNWVNEK